jgi:hypothetical protein
MKIYGIAQKSKVNNKKKGNLNTNNFNPNLDK